MIDKEQVIIITDGILRSMALAEMANNQVLQGLKIRLNFVVFQESFTYCEEEKKILENWIKFIDMLIKDNIQQL